MKLSSRVIRQKTAQLDDALGTAVVPQRPRSGWVAAIRESLGMNRTQLAKRMGIARPGINRLEADETRGAVTLARLQRVADALDCDLQYVLVPRRPLVEIVARQALLRAEQKLGRVNESQALEASAMAQDSFSGAVRDLAKEMEVQRPADLWNE